MEATKTSKLKSQSAKSSAVKSLKTGALSPLQRRRVNFLVVGIGASAGGIQALKEFFENVPADSDIAYVIILHLSPDHDSHLAQILQTVAPIPVTQVQEKVRVETNHVYVVPPDQHLEMFDGHIVVQPNLSIEERRAPVDIFFRTLAELHNSHAVAVILSGTGADGSMGIKRIKEKGGVAFVQNPREAEFSEMPRSSIATELIDAVLNVAEIPAKIIAYKSKLNAVKIPVEPESRPEDDQAALREIFTTLRVRTRHDFSNYKRPTVLRRIERRINVREFDNLPAYAAFIKENPNEAQSLLKDLLISVTNFFRDKEAFEFLERDVIPRILQDKTSSDQIRIWVAGCATGEEAYTIAMLCAEQVEGVPGAPTIQIFATDIDEAAIAAAREGFYTLNDAADVSPERLRRFFIKDGDGFRVRRELREMILFANHNVIKDAPFSHLDLITCRNLLIYFNGTAQERVMETFHFALNPGSFLFLGTSESTDGAGDLYVSVSKEHHIYQSRQATAKIAYPVPDAPPVMRYVEPKTLVSNSSEATQENENRLLERISFGDLHQQLLEQYAPPSIVINENYDIVHLSDHAGRFLQIGGGEPSKNLLHLIRPELRLELRTALYQAVQHQTNVAAKLKIQLDGRNEALNIQVRPVLRQDDTARGFLLVLLESLDENAVENLTEKIISSEESLLVHRLEEELERTKIQLRTTVEQFEIQTEELRASNEELQAMNEELRSTAEELETSREELQSVNEELLTVNQELKIKIEELSQSNNGFHNLLNSTDIGTIFLDRSLRVKLFTPSVRNVFNLIEADLNRPLTDITTKLNVAELNKDIERVLNSLQTVEREVQTGKDNWYLTRIFPYRTAEDHINGVIITLIDITQRKHSEEALRASQQKLETAFKAGKMGSWTLDLQTKEFIASYICKANYGRQARDEFTYCDIADSIYPEDFAKWRKSLEETIEKGVEFQIEHRVLWHDNSIHWVFMRGDRFTDETSNNSHLSGVSIDITERKAAEAKLRESKENLQMIVESAADYAILTLDGDATVNSWNSGAEKIFGWKEQEIIGRSGAILFTPEDRAAGIPEREIKTALKKGRAEDERFHIRKDGSRFYASGVMRPFDQDGRRGFVKIARDMTEHIETEKAMREKEMLQKMINAQEDERKRIARDIHDQLGQELTALRLNLEAVRKLCEDDRELTAKINETQLIAKNIDADIDFLAWELRPAALDDLGLAAALENYVREWSRYAAVASDFHASNSKKLRLMPEIETNLYRIAQEALNNVYKHAEAKNVSVLLEQRNNLVVLVIEDDGKGFNPKNKLNRSKGLGLIGMSERASLAGGTFEIESTPHQGTTVFVRVPKSAPTRRKKRNDR